MVREYRNEEVCGGVLENILKQKGGGMESLMNR
jgi:hypothetical protein